jgi:hypothetical protein
MVRQRALDIWETKLVSCEDTPQAIRSIAKSLAKGGEPKAPPAIHGPLDPIFYSHLQRLLEKPVHSARFI